MEPYMLHSMCRVSWLKYHSRMCLIDKREQLFMGIDTLMKNIGNLLKPLTKAILTTTLNIWISVATLFIINPHSLACNPWVATTEGVSHDTWCYMTSREYHSNPHGIPILMPHQMRCLGYYLFMAVMSLCNFTIYLLATCFYKLQRKQQQKCLFAASPIA
jgi:hypothetical protein